MRKSVNIEGMKFNRLTAVRFSHKHIYPCGKAKEYWIFKCDCGKEKILEKAKVVNGSTLSCGCYAIEKVKEYNTTHHLTKTRLYRIWLGMKSRCYNNKKKDYKNYGGRGIKVCTEWKSDFMNFHSWAMDNGYSDNLTIDRIDVNGNYEPSNCRWVDMKVQAKKRRNNNRKRDKNGRFAKENKDV